MTSSSINDSWDRITTWLKAKSPDDLQLLQPGAPDELDTAATLFGLQLHGDFRQLYQLMNGTDPNGESVGLFPSADEWDDMAFGPCALEQITADWQMQKELLEGGDFADLTPESCDPAITNDWWNVGWIPFAWNGGGDYYCIDMVPTADGTMGQVITHSHETGEHKVLAPSLAAYLNDLADGLDAGKFELTDDGLQKSEADS